ncbi:MAG TPA: DUF3667 domain-containing protein [Ohtaekwangia sp.]
MSHKKYREDNNCLNCGATVEKKFCTECGQENIELHDTFVHMAGHFLADYFHYDSKFFKSLGYLFTRPGFLTKEYLDGKRVNYIPPLRLFFFITIISVLISSLYNKRFEKEILEKTVHVTHSTDSTAATEIELDKLTGDEKAKVEKLNQGMKNFIHDLKYISFFLLPVYAFAFRVVNLKSKKFYVDHLIYTMHLQSFVFALVAIVLIIPLLIYAPAHYIVQHIVIGSTILYTILSLRYLYQQSWLKTIAKALLALSFVGIITGIIRLAYMWIPYFFEG